MKQTETIINTKKVISKELISKRIVNKENLILITWLLLAILLTIYCIFLNNTLSIYIIYYISQYIWFLDLCIIYILLLMIIILVKVKKKSINSILSTTIQLFFIFSIFYSSIYYFESVKILNTVKTNKISDNLRMEYNKSNLKRAELYYNNIDKLYKLGDKKIMDKYQDFINYICDKGSENVWELDESKFKCKKISNYYSIVKPDNENKTYIYNNLLFLFNKEFKEKYWWNYHDFKNNYDVSRFLE